MTESGHAATVRAYWAAAEARDWDAFARTLAPDVVYLMPQTWERVSGRDAYLRFNIDYPGDWHLRIDEVIADDSSAVSRLTVRVAEEELSGICFFAFDGDGRILTVRDYWPESYEPPAGREHLVERYRA